MSIKNQHILVVDDEVKLRKLLKEYLSQEGYEVTTVNDGISMDSFLMEGETDLIILDLMLPGEDGLSIARRLRADSNNQPIIMLSAHGDEVDRIIGLEVGADDYLAKPFSPRELLARIRSVLRRSPNSSSDEIETKEMKEYKFGSYHLNILNHKLTKNDIEIPLSTGEFTLLQLFLAHPNHVLSRDKIIDLTKGYERNSLDRSIDICVGRLRKKIEEDPSQPVHLRTVWGAGYMFSPEG